MKTKPRALVMSGYGLNCEEETKYSFDTAGADTDIVHVNDLIENPKLLARYEILAFPGGFAYGDDTGSGKAYANKIRNHLSRDLEKFIDRDTLTIGICNGFQIITNLGIVPGALTFNEGARYLDRWVDVKIEGKSPWLADIKTLSLPIAHGEGRFYADKKMLKDLNKNGDVAMRYVKGDVAKYLELSGNPNGSLEDIAGVLAKHGRILGMMPHPERAIFSTQHPRFWLDEELARRKGKALPEHAPALQLFRNAVDYFT